MTTDPALRALLREVVDDWMAERARNGFTSWTDSMMRARAALAAAEAAPLSETDPALRALHVLCPECQAAITVPAAEAAPLAPVQEYIVALRSPDTETAGDGL